MWLAVLSGWLDRQEREALGYLYEENRVLQAAGWATPAPHRAGCSRACYLCLAKTPATERNARGRALRGQPSRVSLVATFMEPAAHGESPNCPIAIWHVSRTNRLKLSVLPTRSAQPDEGV